MPPWKLVDVTRFVLLWKVGGFFKKCLTLTLVRKRQFLWYWLAWCGLHMSSSSHPQSQEGWTLGIVSSAASRSCSLQRSEVERTVITITMIRMRHLQKGQQCDRKSPGRHNPQVKDGAKPFTTSLIPSLLRNSDLSLKKLHGEPLCPFLNSHLWNHNKENFRPLP